MGFTGVPLGKTPIPVSNLLGKNTIAFRNLKLKYGYDFTGCFRVLRLQLRGMETTFYPNQKYHPS
jgi:hypothetical protein